VGRVSRGNAVGVRPLNWVVRPHTITSPFVVAMTEFKRGPLKGKKVTYASTDRVAEYSKIAGEFMSEVFDFLPGDCLIADVSSLRDFTDFGSSDTSPIWSRITEIYSIERADIPSEGLADIFAEIQSRRNIQ
jgi:hypothetical protein